MRWMPRIGTLGTHKRKEGEGMRRKNFTPLFLLLDLSSRPHLPRLQICRGRRDGERVMHYLSTNCRRRPPTRFPHRKENA